MSAWVRKATSMAALLCCLAAGSGTAFAYTLDIQDRLRVYVNEWPALNGEVSVGANGSVSLPVIGEVEARGMQPSELATQIADRLKAKANLRQLPDVSVDVVMYRPFYILGSVTTPGEYSYRPNMVVLNAVSIAGGVYRAVGLSEWDLARTSISSTGELRVAELRRSALLAEQIRFEAEVGKRAFPPTPADASPELVRAIEEQRELFEAELQGYENQSRALGAVVQLHEMEIESISQQLEAVAGKLESFEAELATATKLEQQGLSVNRRLPLARDVFDIQREQRQLEFEKVRAERAVQDAKIRIDELDSQRKADALSGLQRVRSQMRELEEQFATLSRLVSGAVSQGEELERTRVAGSSPRLRFTIVRGNGQDVQQLSATETTPVLPGDIIKVDFEGRSSM
ncbi:polysaccharide biosynthesis/export family protein [Rhizobiaceae bacterium BDR2-2]|uniref:Polysaccharide biosynthesis/export family protein n=1 Tax=Ectorhizobium quercum TaxID=2965071 RepID=A0AAE3MY92_9HYPH|nr:polysaccharide biosynthesis/export family protein [Ectorhizobium quercum]MCX8995865.1 polysaccharide biosynthesis/export family protein [Ectorhizobium quercum]